MNWEYLREEEFEGAIERSGGLCILPLGCLEKHGQHLPVGMDSIFIQKLCEQAAELEDVVVFPNTMWLGDVAGYHSMTGDMLTKNKLHGGIGIKPSTILTILEELCDEIARNGFRKILIVNAHGGNTRMLEHFIRSQGYNLKPYATMWTNAYDCDESMPQGLYPLVKEHPEEFPYITEEDMVALEKFAKTGTGGGHADWQETAYMYAYCPEYVAADKFDAESGLSIHRSDYLAKEGVHLTFDWSSNYPNSYNGFAPFGCSETIGKATAYVTAKRLARIYKMLKEDEDCVRMAMRLPKEEK